MFDGSDLKGGFFFASLRLLESSSSRFLYSLTLGKKHHASTFTQVAKFLGTSSYGVDECSTRPHFFFVIAGQESYKTFGSATLGALSRMSKHMQGRQMTC